MSDTKIIGIQRFQIFEPRYYSLRISIQTGTIMQGFFQSSPSLNIKKLFCYNFGQFLTKVNINWYNYARFFPIITFSRHRRLILILFCTTFNQGKYKLVQGFLNHHLLETSQNDPPSSCLTLAKSMALL